MSEMVERVAEAIWRADFANYEDEEGNPRQPPCAYRQMGRSDRNDCEALARAAIAAMREPTEAMILAGADEGNIYTTEAETKAAWQAAIDAALNEEGGK